MRLSKVLLLFEVLDFMGKMQNVNLKLHSSEQGNINGKEIAGDKEIETQMQELVQCVLQRSDGLCSVTKQTFLTIAKSYYYAAHCTPTTLSSHITKVLYQRVP